MPSNLFVVLMGVGTVFVGLICIILLVSLMSWICRKLAKWSLPPLLCLLLPSVR